MASASPSTPEKSDLSELGATHADHSSGNEKSDNVHGGDMAAHAGEHPMFPNVDEKKVLRKVSKGTKPAFGGAL